MIDEPGGERREDLEGRDRIAELEQRYRRATRAIAICVAAVAIAVAIALVRVFGLADEQRAGRRAAVAVTCGATSGVIEAGRSTILSGVKGKRDTPFERKLEKIGYPPREVRRAQAKAAADAYARMIAERVRAAADGAARGVVRRDGTLDCGRLQSVAKSR